MNDLELNRQAQLLDLINETRTYRAVVVQDGKRLYCAVSRGENYLSPLPIRIHESRSAREMAWRLCDLARRLKGERFYLIDDRGNEYELDQKSLARPQRRER